MLKPLFARVVIERETLKHGSIIIPEDAGKRNAPAKGVVVAMGPECDESIQVGQSVLFGRYAGDWFEDGDREVYVCQDEDIIAVIEDE